MSLVAAGCSTGSARPAVAPQRERVARSACEGDPRFVYVPAGRFVFGSTPGERDDAYRMAADASGHSDDERVRAEQTLRTRQFFDGEPSRATIDLGAYCLARNPVTQDEYAAFVRATGHRSPSMDPDTWRTQGFLVHSFDEVTRYVWRDGHPPDGQGRWPVVLVSVDDANAYAHWRGAHDGRVYELPTREEWERASRGTDGRLYPWGNDWRPDAINWEGSRVGHPEVVGTRELARGESGTNDMLGNVFEWTSTRDGSRTVLKGCAFDDVPGFCRSAYEHRRESASRHILIGFRLAWR